MKTQLATFEKLHLGIRSSSIDISSIDISLALYHKLYHNIPKNDSPQVDISRSRGVAESTHCKVQRCAGEQNNYQRIFPGNPQGVEGSMALPWPHPGGNSTSWIRRKSYPEEKVPGNYCMSINKVFGYHRWN